LEKITSIEQALCTGLTEDGQKAGIPQDFTQIIRNNDILVTDKLRLLLLLYVTNPTALKQRQQYELNSGLSNLDQEVIEEWCRLIQTSGRPNQRRAPLNDQEWQFLTSRYLPAIYDIARATCDNKLSSAEFSYHDSSEKNFLFGSENQASNIRGKRTSIRPNFGVGATTGVVKQPALYIFVAGGISYNEIRVVHELSKELCRDIIIGSTHIISPLDLIDQISYLNQHPDKAPCYKPSFIGDAQDYFS